MRNKLDAFDKVMIFCFTVVFLVMIYMIIDFVFFVKDAGASEPEISGRAFIMGELWTAREGVPLYLVDENGQLVDFEFSGPDGQFVFDTAPSDFSVVACGNTPWGYVYGARDLYGDSPYWGFNIYAYVQAGKPECPQVKQQVFLPSVER